MSQVLKARTHHRENNINKRRLEYERNKEHHFFSALVFMLNVRMNEKK